MYNRGWRVKPLPQPLMREMAGVKHEVRGHRLAQQILGPQTAFAGQVVPRQRTCEIDSGACETITDFSRNPFLLIAIRHRHRLRRLFELRADADPARAAVWCYEHFAPIEILEHNYRGAAN